MVLRKSQPNTWTQFSGIDNCINVSKDSSITRKILSVQALILAEKALRCEDSIVTGEAYNIVDGGPVVDSWRFWYPLFEAAGASPPRISLPYWLVYGIALLMEYLYLTVGIPPLLTRFEVRWLDMTFI